jgi:AmiR/NasT family two-component response regulator
MTPSRPRSQPIRVAVVADSEHAAPRLVSALASPSCQAHPLPLASSDTPRRVTDLQPEVILVRAGEVSLPAALSLARTARHTGAAVVLLTPQASARSLEAAQGLGAMTHLLEPVTSQALLAAVIVAHARAQDYRELEQALRAARHSAKTREVVEQAKQALMRRFGLGEEEAHRMLQKESRSRNRKLMETAEQVLRAESRFARVRVRATSAAESRLVRGRA